MVKKQITKCAGYDWAPVSRDISQTSVIGCVCSDYVDGFDGGLKEYFEIF